MIWATLSYQSCFCWLFGASSSSAAKNMINLISVLTIWWCPCVESSLMLLEEGIAMTSMFSWQNSVRLYPASFCTPRPNLCVTPGVSWLPTFAFQVPIMKMTSFWVLVLEGLVGLHRTVQLQLLQDYWLGIDLDYCVVERFALERNWNHSVVFEIVPEYCISGSFID